VSEIYVLVTSVDTETPKEKKVDEHNKIKGTHKVRNSVKSPYRIASLLGSVETLTLTVRNKNYVKKRRVAGMPRRTALKLSPG